MAGTMLVRICRVIKRILYRFGLGRFYSKEVHGFVHRCLKSDFAIVRGHKMFLGPEDSLGLSLNPVYEEYETEIMEKEISEGDVILDIGANIGYFTLLFARWAGKKGKVFSFEPDPANFALLKKNVEVNGYENVVLVNKAVSDKTWKSKLHLSEENKVDHRIYNSHDGRKSVEIQSMRLDDYFKGYKGKVDFIKMDIQGAEGRAVKGMPDLLKKNKNMKLVSEFWPVGLDRAGVEPAEYLKLLLKQGFEIKEIDTSKRKTVPVTVANLLKTYTIEEENYTNLFCY